LTYFVHQGETQWTRKLLSNLCKPCSSSVVGPSGPERADVQAGKQCCKQKCCKTKWPEDEVLQSILWGRCWNQRSPACSPRPAHPGPSHATPSWRRTGPPSWRGNRRRDLATHGKPPVPAITPATGNPSHDQADVSEQKNRVLPPGHFFAARRGPGCLFCPRVELPCEFRCTSFTPPGEFSRIQLQRYTESRSGKAARNHIVIDGFLPGFRI